MYQAIIKKNGRIIATPEITKEQAEQLMGEKIDLATTPLEEMDLTVRSYNLLRRRGISTVEQLMQLTRSELTRIRGMGKKSLEEIIEKGKEYRKDFPKE